MPCFSYVALAGRIHSQYLSLIVGQHFSVVAGLRKDNNIATGCQSKGVGGLLLAGDLLSDWPALAIVAAHKQEVTDQRADGDSSAAGHTFEY